MKFLLGIPATEVNASKKPTNLKKSHQPFSH